MKTILDLESALRRLLESEKVRKWESGKVGRGSPSHRLTFSLSCLCLYLLFPCFSHAAEEAAVALYNRAGRAYEAEQYEAAVALYEKITKGGIRDGSVYYNLGNAYFKAGRMGKAILSYERARRLLPRDEDIEANLGFVRLLKVDKEPPEGRNVVVRFVLNLYDAFSLNGLTKAASGLYILMLLSGIGWILYGRRFRSVFAAILIILGAVFVPVCGVLAFKIHAEAFVREAIVISDEVDAFSGPGAEHTKIFAVHEGTKVSIERRDGDWALVRLNSGIGGWVEGKGMEEI